MDKRIVAGRNAKEAHGMTIVELRAFCPCHLPLTLGILVTVFGCTAAGAVLRDHIVLRRIVITAAWVAGTWRGFRFVRLAQQGRLPAARSSGGTCGSQDMTFGPATGGGRQSR